MPCCGFALFVIGQLVAGFLVVGRALGFSGADRGPGPLNAATAWQLDRARAGAAPAIPLRARRRRFGRRLLLVGVLEAGLLVAGAVWLHGGEALHGAHHAASPGDASGPNGAADWSEVASLHD